MRTLFSLLAAFMLFCGSALPAFAAEKAYINGIDANYPPFAYVDKSGKPAGFDVESMDWIAKKMGFTITHKPMDWGGIIPELLAGRIDMVCSGMSISPERQAKVTFSTPYFTIKKVLLVRANSKLTKEEILTGKKKLGTQRSTQAATWLEDNVGGDIALYDTQENAYLDLTSGRLDGILADKYVQYEWLKSKDGSAYEFKGDPVVESDKIGIAVRKGDPLRERLNKALAEIKADGTYKKINDKYFPFSIE